MKKFIYMSLAMALILGFMACGDDNEPKDMTPPTITGTGITCNPINCQVYHPGEVIPFRYVFEDNEELGNFNLEVHNNFDHHTHSTEGHDHEHEGSECEEQEHEHEEGEEHGEEHAWVYNRSFSIPTGLKSYNASIDIPIPEDAAHGDYHFMIRLTDKAGWQQIKSIAIIIEE
jgi:hypothetical protein